MTNSSSAATPTPPLKQITFAFPFRKKGQGNRGAAADFTDEHEVYRLLKQESSGSFPVSSGGMWHGGIHVTEAGAGQSMDLKGGVRSIADGEVGVLFPTGDGAYAADELSSIGQGAQDSGFPWVAFRASRLIPKHESEWANPAKWQELISAIEQHTGPKPEHEEEKKRITNLVWWDEVTAGVSGFPGSDVFHIHPVALVGNFTAKNLICKRCGASIILTKDFTKKIAPNANGAFVDEFFSSGCTDD
ncbi:hypothetical protein [Paraburkholderia ferrariae]|uniref:hypothetical protein n=1 Tax=Paraburkholderia ferrariae TaxID=386056 RepID=UPI0038993F93